MTFPIRGRAGERALFTITDDSSEREWQEKLHDFKRHFQLLSYHLHQMIMRTEGVLQEPVRLSRREMECLRWKASGKTVPEIAIILNLSEKTIRFYLDLARGKLNATNGTHAVAKALSQDLIFGVR